MKLNGIETGGHDWKRDYGPEGEPYMTMTHEACGYVWLPHLTLRQIGRCPVENPEDAT